MEARDYILMGGCELHREQTRQVLMEAEVLNEEAEYILTDQQLSNYMRYNLIKDMVCLECLRFEKLCSISMFHLLQYLWKCVYGMCLCTCHIF